MQFTSNFLVVLLIHFAYSVRCIPEDGGPDLKDYDSRLLYDDSDLGFQPNLHPFSNSISADTGDPCSTFDVLPNRKIRARETMCPPKEKAAPEMLTIPTLDNTYNTEYLCPFDMKLGPRVLVCGKPVSIEGLTPDILTTVEDARLCKFMRLPKELVICVFIGFCGILTNQNVYVFTDPRLPQVKCAWPDFIFCCERIEELVSYLERSSSLLDRVLT